MNKRETHVVQGMSRDLAMSRFNPNLVCDARNIRITPLKNNSTLLSVTNEKGTASAVVQGSSIIGTVVGYAVLNNVLVLFTSDSGIDRIYKVIFTDSYETITCVKLFEDNLGLRADHPLETLPIYENSQIQKVYWVDGVNQPRVINITGNTLITNNDFFNFNRKIDGGYKMEITKFNSGGEFPAGTVQYCFNYFNKFGQETNIVDISPLYYLCPKDKGLPADALSNSSFLIKLSGLDSSYEYVRLYSIIRTSENATPNVHIVGDYKISTVQSIAEWEEQNPPFDVFSYANAYVYDINTGEEVFKVDAQYPEPDLYQSVDIPLLGTQALYVSSSGYLYAGFSRNTGNKRTSISISHDVDGVHVYRNSPSVAIKRSRFTGSYVDSVVTTDTGIVGSTIDASALLFLGGQNIVPATMTHKDTTLFFGNVKQNTPNIGTLLVGGYSLRDVVRGRAEACVYDYAGNEKDSFVATLEDYNYVAGANFYNQPIDNNKSSYDTKFFKARENYRLGLIAQYQTGEWSEAVWIDDADETFAPGTLVFYQNDQPEYNHFWGASYRKPGFKATIPSSVVNALKSAGFIRIAPVAVYPEFSDRKVLFQGLLSGTVYNVDDRRDNSPYVQADWRFRIGYDDTRINGEIQCNTYDAAPKYPTGTKGGNILTADEFVNYYANQYYRDSSILSFHSPDIEEDENIVQSDISDAKLRIVGISNLGFNYDSSTHTFSGQTPEIVADSFITTTSQGYSPDYAGIKDFSFFAGTTEKNPRNTQQVVSHTEDLAFNGYQDNAVAVVNSGDHEGKISTLSTTKVYRWITYLWHRNGSLNNQSTLSAESLKYGSIRYAMLGKKCISEIRYGRTTFFQTVNSFGPTSVPLAINSPKFYDSDQLSVSKLDAGNRGGILYYGNIDKVIVPNFKDVTGVTCQIDSSSTSDISSKGYPIEYESVVDYSDAAQASSSTTNTNSGRPQRQGGSTVSYIPRNSYNESSGTGGDPVNYGKDPVLMRYRSTKHIVLGLNSGTDDVIHQLGYLPLGAASLTYPAFWNDNTATERVDVLHDILDNSNFNGSGTLFTNMRNVVYVAELYRDFTEERLAARFGGNSQEAILNNVWTRCGDSVQLQSNEAATLFFKEGDTYLGRYDCLKSYPLTDEDQNQIVSIYSTEIESRVNLDARYDKNRGLSSNMYVRPTNFNLFNHPGYEQKNQYFTYKAIDYDRYRSLTYPNMITWSLEKKMGADIDAWTSIPMTSTGDAQGDLGEITKLVCFNDNIFCFQNRGVSQLLFNERVQVPVSDGQPIEITNGLKFGGLRYLSNQIGLSNKWSLCETPYGVYFIDDEKNTLYQMSGQKFEDLSTKKGFRTWLAENNSYDVWNPVEYNNIRTFYDKLNGDLYFMGKEESLVYSEQLGTFTSFMDYAGLPMLANINDKFFAVKKEEDSAEDRLHQLFAGPFNLFFNEFKPYWLTFISNSDPTIDKVYDNLGWRTIDYSYVTSGFAGYLEPMKTFDMLRVWNDHQDTGEVDLYDTAGKPSILKKKFNVFRAQIPRDKLGAWKGKGLNRIRNTWTYIQLARRVENTDFMQFSDLDVDFFE